MDGLLRTYWRPVYAYVRRAWGKTVEDSKDLTQAFFLRLLDRHYISELRNDQGSFRGYLKVSLKHFLLNQERSEQVRRPPGAALNWEVAQYELAAVDESISQSLPDQAYEEQWLATLVHASVEILRKECVADEKAKEFEVFQAYCLKSTDAPSSPVLFLEEPAVAPTYEEIARRIGLQKWEVRNSLVRCRHRLREILRARVLEYVATPEDLDRELREILEC